MAIEKADDMERITVHGCGEHMMPVVHIRIGDDIDLAMPTDQALAMAADIIKEALRAGQEFGERLNAAVVSDFLKTARGH